MWLCCVKLEWLFQYETFYYKQLDMCKCLTLKLSALNVEEATENSSKINEWW